MTEVPIKLSFGPPKGGVTVASGADANEELVRVQAEDADFNESEHPRGEGGKFTSGSGASLSGSGEIKLPKSASLLPNGYHEVVYHHTLPQHVPSILKEGVREGTSILGTGTFFSEGSEETPTAVSGKSVVSVPIEADRVVELNTVFDLIEFMKENHLPMNNTAKEMRDLGVQAIRFKKPPTGKDPWLVVFDPKIMGKAKFDHGAEDVRAIATDPPVSEAQRRLMWAAASGHVEGVPQSVGKEFAAADPGGKLPEKKTAKDMTRSGWRRIYEGLSELARFFGEEEREPEHRGSEDDFRHARGQMFDGAPKGRAASVAFTTRDGRVLLVRRSPHSDNYPGYWGLPGGQVEDGESESEAARRECEEELGPCSLDGMRELRRVRTPHGWDHTTYAVPAGDAFEPRLNSEHTEHAWVPVTRLPEKVHPGVRETIDQMTSPEAVARWVAEEHGKVPAGEDQTGTEGKWYKKIVATDRGKRVFGRLQNDMEPGDFDELIGLLTEFFREESREPEHQARDASQYPILLTIELSEWDNLSALLQFWDYVKKSAGGGHSFLIAADESADGTGRKMFGKQLAGAVCFIDGDGNDKIGKITLNGKDIDKVLAKDGVILDQSDTDPDRHVYGREPRTPHEFGRDSLAHDEIGIWPYSMAADRDSVRTVDDAGRMHVSDSVLSKAVVSPYLGSEINGVMKDDPSWQMLEPDRKYMLLRDPKELAKAVDTFNGLPLLWRHQAATASDHPTEIVVGSTGTSAKFRDPDLTNDLVIWPAYATKAVEDGERKALSCGYGYRAVMEPGVHNGQRFDGRMVDIKGNHVALVDQPRVPGAQVGGDSGDELLWLDLADAIRGIAV